MKTPIESTEPSPTITPSTTSERAPMKQLSSMIDRVGLQRLEHAADADAARDVAVLADLRAGADGRPGVDHRAAVDIGADIDEARHQHDARRDIGGAAHDAAGHGAEAGVAEPASVQPANFDGTLSHQSAAPARVVAAAGDHVVDGGTTAAPPSSATGWSPTCRHASRRRGIRRGRAPSSAAWTASSTWPLVPVLISARRSQAASMICCSSFVLMRRSVLRHCVKPIRQILGGVVNVVGSAPPAAPS